MKQILETVSPASNEGRNLYVVRQITKAVLKLMQNKNLSDLTISQICDEAGVGRASFYRNFESKEDVLHKHLKDLANEWTNQHEGLKNYNIVEAIFDHFWTHKELFIMLYRQGLAHISLQSIKDACGPKPEQTNITAYTTAYLSYGLYGWIEEWFKRGLQETPTEMAELCQIAQQGNIK